MHAQARDEILVDFRRGRLLKKLVLLIRGPSLAAPLERLRTHSLLNILAIVVVHVIFFAVLMTQLDTRDGCACNRTQLRGGGRGVLLL